MQKPGEKNYSEDHLETSPSFETWYLCDTAYLH